MGPPTLWKVIYREGGKLKLKKFGADLTEATAFYKQRRREGHEAHLVSMNRAFPPFPKGHKRYEERPSSKHLWCPFCMRWRVYHVTALRTDGILGEPRLRCPICTISVYDGAVKKYNHLWGSVDMDALRKAVGAW